MASHVVMPVKEFFHKIACYLIDIGVWLFKLLDVSQEICSIYIIVVCATFDFKVHDYLIVY